eukprot:jgi/Mesvir1/25458/Mv01727-RA.2
MVASTMAFSLSRAVAPSTAASAPRNAIRSVPCARGIPCLPRRSAIQQSCHLQSQLRSRASTFELLAPASRPSLCKTGGIRHGVVRCSAAGAAPAAKPEKAKKPRLPAFDACRFFLVAYIATGHFIAMATKDQLILRMFSQINVAVGAFFVLSGYLAAYTSSEIGKYEASPRLQPEVGYFLGRVSGFYPTYLLIQALFAPVFLFADLTFNGPIKTALHALITTSLSQAWFPGHAELWNAPTWFLSALAFAMLVLPYVLPRMCKFDKKALKATLVTLTVVSVLAKLGYSYGTNSWTALDGMLAGKQHANLLLFNTMRFHPFYALIEILMGATAARLVMLDGVDPKDKVQAVKEGDPAPLSQSALIPLLGMVGIILARGFGWVAINDMLTRGLIFIPLTIAFFMRLHRESLSGNGPVAKALSWGPLVALGNLSFALYIVHGPVGQVMYKKVIATKLFGGPLSAYPWAFPVWIASVFIRQGLWCGILYALLESW